MQTCYLVILSFSRASKWKRSCKDSIRDEQKNSDIPRELNRVTQAKVISMRYRLFIFHKSLSKRAQYFGISVPRKNMSQRIVYEPRQRVRKKIRKYY